MTQKFKIKKGDSVVVTAGKDKGRTGEVTKVITKDMRVLVSGVNMVRRHTKQTQQNEGGIVPMESPIHISNVSLIDPESDKATRVRFETRDGVKVRVATRSGAVVE